MLDCNQESPHVVCSVPSRLYDAGYCVCVIDTGTRRRLAASDRFNTRVRWYWGGIAIKEAVNDATEAHIQHVGILPAHDRTVCEKLGHDCNSSNEVVVIVKSGERKYEVCGYCDIEKATLLGIKPESYSYYRGVVDYMRREDDRVLTLARILSKETTKEIHYAHAAELIQQHALYLARQRERHIPLSEEVISTRILFDQKLSQLFDAKSELSIFELAVFEGALGDLSWEDKRELFRGDSDHHTLQKAYDISASVSDITKDAFSVIGKIGAGAGWSGMAPVFCRREYIPILSELIRTRYATDQELVEQERMDPAKVSVWPCEGANGTEVVFSVL